MIANIVPPIQCIEPRYVRMIYRLYVRGVSYEDIMSHLFLKHGIVANYGTIDMIIDFYNQILL